MALRVYGHLLDTAGLRDLVGSLDQVVGLRSVELEDGVERGVRAIEGRTGGGLDFTALVERALDIADVHFEGLPLAWRAPTGYAAPWFYDARPMGFLRTMGGGLFVTAGLDHVLYPVKEAEPVYAHPLIGERDYPMHGRIAHVPARVTEVAQELDSEMPLLRVRGVARQASLFGEDLELDRTIEAFIGEPELRITDRVTNLAGTPCPHMMLYHVNLGFPLLEPGVRPFGSEHIETQRAPATESFTVPFAPFGEPVRGAVEQVFCHRVIPDVDGFGHAYVFNEHHGLAFGVAFDTAAMPYLFEWRVERSGVYALGFEPSTVDLGGRGGAREKGTLRFLEPGETVNYKLRFRAVRAMSIEGARKALQV